MDAKRQRIIDAIVTRMQGITVLNGYKTDLGNRVGDWETNWDERDLPALSVCDMVQTEELMHGSQDARQQINTLPVILKIFARSTTTAKDLRNMIADIYQAIRVDKQWSNLALYTLPKRGGMELSEEGFKLGGAGVEIEILYLTETFNAET